MEPKNLLENQITKEKRNTLNVCFFSHSAGLYGAERALLDLVAELIKDYGVTCTVILPKDGPLREKLEQAGAATRIIDYSWWYDQEILTDEQVTELCINSAKNLLYNLKQMLRRINPDIVFTNTMSIPWGAVAASFLGKPHVWFIHEFGESDHNLKLFLPLNATLKFIENLSALILTNSEAVRKELFPNVSEEKALTVYQHISIPPTFIYQNGNNYFTRKNSTKLVINASVNEGKGQKDAILAVKELKRRGRDVELIIIGHCISQYADQLKAMVIQENLKGRVRFIGFKENPYPIINQTDISLVCSRKEAFGRATVESMLLKKPVIGTNRGGTPELIKDGFNGLLYAPGDYNQLADKIEYLINNPNKTEKLTKNGYEFVNKTFTRSNFGRKVYKLLLNLKRDVSLKPAFSGSGLEGPALLDSLLNTATCKDRKITALITELGSFLKLRDSQITEFTNNLQEKDSQIQEKDSQIQEKDSQIQEKESQIQEKESQIQEKESQIQEKDSQIQEKESQIQEKDSQIQNLEYQLQQVQQSILIQLASRYHRIMEKLLPPDTRRRHYYELCLTGIRIILNEGWRNFFRKARYWFTSYRPPLLTPLHNSLQEFNTPLSKPKTSSNLIKGIPNPDKIASLDETGELVFKPVANPLVSIVILAYNQWQYTYVCLKSVLENTTGVNYEVILADNCSTDLTSAMLKKVKGTRIINNKENLGFVKGCNGAAAFAKGKYILFLNNDTYVTKNWLEALLEPAEKDEKVGIVGPNLISPDGKLQENGWIMGLDGWGQPIGRGKNPNNYEYNYLKEVDCVTGACLLVRKDIFLKVGSFDEIYAPGYYEEFDLAFAVKNKGYKIVLQPKAKIVHFNNVTFGPNNRDSLSSRNQAKFLKKWRSALERRPEKSNNYFWLRDQSQGKRVILIIDHKIPEYDKDAGSLTTYQYIALFRNLGFKVIFLPDNLRRTEPYTTEIQQLGVEVIYGHFNFNSWIKDNSKHIDIVWLSRPDVSMRYLNELKNHTGAKILYFTHDLHHLREQRRALLEKNDDLMKESKRLKDIEFKIFQSVDVVMTPSSVEKDIISKEFPNKKVEVIPLHFWEDFPSKAKTEFEKRKDLIFIGGFTHLPNVDGVFWFVKEIFPRILARLPEIKLLIVGSYLPKKIRDLASDRIIVTGPIRDLRPYFKKARVFVVPLRYGAGLKGKIITSMYYGVPFVITTMANEGFEMIDGEDALIADDPKKFTEKVVELYTNKDLWEKLSRNSIKLIKKRFSTQVARQKILSIVGTKRNENKAILEKARVNRISEKGIICLRPFTTMCFLYDGNTYSCPCPNWPKYNIGNIKHNTIAEMWNSDTARWIRRKMYAGEWQDICNPNCPVISDYLRSNKFIKYEDLEKNDLLTPKLIEEIRAKKDYLESPPTFFKPDTSGACNLNCIMCDRKYQKDDPAMQKKLWANLKNYLPTTKEIQLTGHGEPFVRPDTRELLINYRGPLKFHIITNGLLLPKYWEKIKHQKFASLLISIDAATKETYEKIRRGGKWENLLESLELVNKNKGKFGSIALSMTVMRSNYREIPQFIDLAAAYGFDCIFNSIYGKWGDENIFELKDTEAVGELRNIVITEGSKKRNIDIHWGTLLAELNIPSSVNLHSL